jgi:hypothetical protein
MPRKKPLIHASGGLSEITSSDVIDPAALPITSGTASPSGGTDGDIYLQTDVPAGTGGGETFHPFLLMGA